MNHFYNNGVSLLEVLLSIVILSIGMLGIANLQLSASRFNHSAGLRSIAAQQAYNMMDRIRANKSGANAGAYNNLSGLPRAPSCSTCTGSQIAIKDISEWNTENATLLPQGQGSVLANGNVFTVTIHWDNNRTGATGLNCSTNLDVDLSCIQISGEL